MDIHHIRYFLAVCDTLNFTRAAELCNVTQPALSRAIQQLEDEIGGLMLRRERNLTHLTDLGQLMRPRLQAIADELNDVQREIKKFQTADQSHLNLGVLRSIGPRRLAGFLGSFGLSHPEYHLRLCEGMPEDFDQKLSSGEIDAAIMARPGQFPAGFDAQSLYRERFLIAFSAGHRFAEMTAIPFAELDGETYLRRLTCEFRGYLAGEIKSQGCALNVCFQSDREDWILNMVAGGMGICFIPEFSAVVPGILTRPVVQPAVWREVCLVTKASHTPNAELINLTQALKAHPWPDSRFVSKPAGALSASAG